MNINEFFQNKDSRQVFLYLGMLFILLLLIFNFAFKNGAPTCNHFMMNIYLYLGLSLTILAITCYITEYYNIQINMLSLLLLFILTIALIIMIHYVQFNKNIFLNHLLWFVLIICFGLTLAPVVNNERYKPYINSSIMIVTFIFIGMTLLTYAFPKFFESTYEAVMSALFIGLIAIIIVEIINIIYKSVTKQYEFSKFNRFTSYIVILIFTAFVGYDTTFLKIKSRRCKEESVFNYPNYPLDSLQLILDVINLFIRTLSLQGNN
jgi:FtsH-binding integral membrane protein